MINKSRITKITSNKNKKQEDLMSKTSLLKTIDNDEYNESTNWKRIQRMMSTQEINQTELTTHTKALKITKFSSNHNGIVLKT